MLHVCFVGTLSEEAISHAKDENCLYEPPVEVFAFTNYSRSKTQYTTRMRIDPTKGEREAYHLAVDIALGAVPQIKMIPGDSRSGDAVRVRPLGPTRFSALAATCIASSSPGTVHAVAAFSFAWDKHTTFIELPARSPDERFTLRGVRIADADDENYVILDVPGPTNEKIKVSCSLSVQLDGPTDENLLNHALDKLDDHIGSLIARRE